MRISLNLTRKRLKKKIYHIVQKGVNASCCLYQKVFLKMLDDLKYKKEEGLSEKEAQFIQIFEFYMRKYLLKRKTLSFGDPLKNTCLNEKEAQQQLTRSASETRVISREIIKVNGLSASYLPALRVARAGLIRTS